jgi:hypothetical protein
MTTLLKIVLALGFLAVGLAVVAAASAAGFTGGILAGGALGYVLGRRKGSAGRVIDARATAAAVLLVLLVGAGHVQAKQVLTPGHVLGDARFNVVRYDRGRILPAAVRRPVVVYQLAPRYVERARCYSGLDLGPGAVLPAVLDPLYWITPAFYYYPARVDAPAHHRAPYYAPSYYDGYVAPQYHD